jgi:hypothetical protein
MNESLGANWLHFQIGKRASSARLAILTLLASARDVARALLADHMHALYETSAAERNNLCEA